MKLSGAGIIWICMTITGLRIWELLKKRVRLFEETEGFVEMLRDIEGVEVAVLLKEKEDANGYKCSLRSHETIKVSDIALLLGGGGHPGAAGCFISGTVEQVKNKIVNAIRQELIKE